MEKKTDFKALSTRAKFDYIWDYYKFHILAVIVAVCVVVSLIHHYVTYREPILNVIMINCIGGDLADDSGFDEFLESYGHDPAEEPVSLSSNLYFSENSSTDSYTNMQVLAAMMAAGDQDLFFGTGDIYLSYADQGALADLSAVLPADILEQYKDSLIYTTEAGTRDAYPCAIELSDNSWLSENNYYDTCYFGIFYNAPHLDTVLEFADFLLTQQS